MTTTHQYIFGLHAVEILLRQHPQRILQLWVWEDRSDKKIAALLELAKQHSISIIKTSRAELDRMTQAANHQGIVANSETTRIYAQNDLVHLLEKVTTPLLLILDGVQDPHNLGACLRSAAAAGVHAVIVPKDKAVGITPVVSKVASGAAEIVPFVQVTNLARAMEELKERGIWIYGAAAEATQTLYQVDWAGPVAIVMGAEGAGLRHLTRERCDGLVKIPMSGQAIASLNVSVATGIFLFEAVRQRG